MIATEAEPGSGPPYSDGLQVRITDKIQWLLERGARLEPLTTHLHAEAHRFLSQPAGTPVPVRLLTSLAAAVREDRGGRGFEGPWVHEVVQGADVVLPAAPQRVKSAELQARLRRLQMAAEEREYQSLVADVTTAEAREKNRQPFSTYKDQLGFGLHVIVTMGTGFLFGHFAFRALYRDDPTMQGMGGVLGLVAAMLLETTLFIIRASRADYAESKED